ncbi:T-cell immunoglobulin and mucin domain-containing protein 4-like isoform X7 [Tachysurus fulvidraco]|uniref:T-cell immunoglobulin and mucin domain-containing protein 4-like isoform X7 n=1 Tax=Tachysurus fulvidraco TaxID=1234273 RepID=UPI001FEF7CF9|nr:T-cell immunoglobulin and mucin domain-containing protein 4-like isoform X7 [Tachysurus fulvidraco]
MNQLRCCIFSLVLLSFTVCTCSAKTVYGFEGQDINLPCKYDSAYHGVCDVCWMKGSIPNNGCGAQIIYANEKEVVMRDSVRYQLNGNLKMGDASLTIRKARLSDSGKYGCRVHVPGWFNDKKFEVNLAIRKAMKPVTTTTQAPVLTTPVPTTFPETTKQTEAPQTITTTTPLIPTQEPVFTTQNDIATTSEPATTVNTEPVFTTQNDIATTSEPATTVNTVPVSTTNDKTTTSPEKVTTKHTGSVSYMQNETTGLPVNVTSKHTEPVFTTQNDIATTSEPATTVNTGPVSTTNDKTTTSPEKVTTKHTEPVFTTQNDIATTSEPATTVNTGSVSSLENETTSLPVNATTKQEKEIYPDKSSMENNMPMKEVKVLPAILVTVLLILLFMGIVALYLIFKHKRRFMATLRIAKNSSSSVKYNNLENSVTLPMTSSSDNEMS